MRLLIVKTSSMGDVVHALPVVGDILRRHPDAEIDWLVESPFAAIPQMHPGVRRVLTMSWRKWRTQLHDAATWRAMGRLRDELRSGGYDGVLDLQGLLKSALWARQAGAPVLGYDGASAREPAAAWFYKHKAAVSVDLQAVQRCRLLAAAHLGYEVAGPLDFGLRAPAPTWTPRAAYAVLIPNASRREKLWPERHWVAVGRRLLEKGWMPVVLWGRNEEQTLAERIAASCEGDVPPFLRVGEMAAVLAGAHQVVGLDTGFTHLAAALGRPTLGIYCDHDPGLAGITGPGRVASIGGKSQVPGARDVLALLETQLAA
ncbi:MAG: lipopolysaccharide heptosyltransferase I [Leptothrix sp. (in: Bacteria)]|nr:lipopolysaccharide heptosyltransferase I [Leptothrix sp. (in: b-proteobacteria)]